MTIYMITRDHEYEGGNGWYDETYVDEDFGYYVDRDQAEAKLVELRAAEAASHKRQWEERSHKPWLQRKAERDRVEANNNILVANGGSTTPVPHLYPEPVYPGWNDGMSDYNITVVEPAQKES
jgi:hypothetical protein